MRDDQKTKEQLIDELEMHRQRVAELESKIERLESKEEIGSKKSLARHPRVKIDADIEFTGDFDIVKAKGINFSEGGICFELTRSLPFEMKFELEGEIRDYRAHLIWMKRFPEGGYRFGLQFVQPEPHPEI